MDDDSLCSSDEHSLESDYGFQTKPTFDLLMGKKLPTDIEDRVFRSVEDDDELEILNEINVPFCNCSADTASGKRVCLPETKQRKHQLQPVPSIPTQVTKSKQKIHSVQWKTSPKKTISKPGDVNKKKKNMKSGSKIFRKRPKKLSREPKQIPGWENDEIRKRRLILTKKREDAFKKIAAKLDEKLRDDKTRSDSKVYLAPAFRLELAGSGFLSEGSSTVFSEEDLVSGSRPESPINLYVNSPASLGFEDDVSSGVISIADGMDLLLTEDAPHEVPKKSQDFPHEERKKTEVEGSSANGETSAELPEPIDLTSVDVTSLGHHLSTSEATLKADNDDTDRIPKRDSSVEYPVPIDLTSIDFTTLEHKLRPEMCVSSPPQSSVERCIRASDDPAKNHEMEFIDQVGNLMDKRRLQIVETNSHDIAEESQQDDLSAMSASFEEAPVNARFLEKENRASDNISRGYSSIPIASPYRLRDAKKFVRENSDNESSGIEDILTTLPVHGKSFEGTEKNENSLENPNLIDEGRDENPTGVTLVGDGGFEKRKANYQSSSFRTFYARGGNTEKRNREPDVKPFPVSLRKSASKEPILQERKRFFSHASNSELATSARIHYFNDIFARDKLRPDVRSESTVKESKKQPDVAAARTLDFVRRLKELEDRYSNLRSLKFQSRTEGHHQTGKEKHLSDIVPPGKSDFVRQLTTREELRSNLASKLGLKLKTDPNSGLKQKTGLNSELKQNTGPNSELKQSTGLNSELKQNTVPNSELRRNTGPNSELKQKTGPNSKIASGKIDFTSRLNARETLRSKLASRFDLKTGNSQANIVAAFSSKSENNEEISVSSRETRRVSHVSGTSASTSISSSSGDTCKEKYGRYFNSLLSRPRYDTIDQITRAGRDRANALSTRLKTYSSNLSRPRTTTATFRNQTE